MNILFKKINHISKKTFNLLIVFLSTILIQYELKSQTQFGITLCGAEFGAGNLPGVLGKDYIYPSQHDIQYFNQKGAEIIQLPFRWERLQKNLGGPLDTTEIGYINRFIDVCLQHGTKVILIMQNYGRYKINGVEYVVGSPQVSQEHYKDFWKKFAEKFTYKINIYAYGIMSEPNNMQGYSWYDAAQKAIYGIREVDRHTTILVDGENYSNPFTWVAYNDMLKYLRDPINRLVFNAHCYFDRDFSGSYKDSYENSGADEWIGVRRLKPFVDWLKQNSLRGYVGEFGVPKNDTRWLTVMNRFLEYIDANGLGGCYWAAGRWWNDYPLSIQPKHGVDQPQLLVYQKYLQGFNTTSASNYKATNSNTSTTITSNSSR